MSLKTEFRMLILMITILLISCSKDNDTPALNPNTPNNSNVV